VPAVLAAHVGLLLVACGVSAVLTAVGVQSHHYDDDGQWTGPPGVVTLASLAVAVLAVVLVIRKVGRRRPGRLTYWLAGTACWAVVPLAWLTVPGAASSPETVVWSLLLFVLTPYGWVFLVPALVIGAAWTAVLAFQKS
jgi:hypothetical protein